VNFTYTEDQLAIKDVADKIFRDMAADDKIKVCFSEDKPFHKALWKTLGESGLIAATLPAEVGGSEMGMTELSLVIEAQGTSVAPIPFIETVVECAMPIAKFANTELQQRVLPRVTAGDTVLSAVRPYDGLQDLQPLTVKADGDNWVLNGVSALVSYAPLANGFLIVAHNDAEKDGFWVGYCDADISGLTQVKQNSITSEAVAQLTFENVIVAARDVIAVDEKANELIEWQTQRTYAAIASQQIGVLKDGLRRAAEYTTERKQFGRPLSKFQAVAQQAADAYMAIEALRGVSWRALDDIDSGRDAALSARVAKFWVCEAGHIAGHIFLHIHGGIGQDLDYPLHRYFTWAKRNENYLGAATKMSVALGDIIKAAPEKVAI